jgi:DNA polymerase-1
MMAAQLDQPDLPKALGAMWRYLMPIPPWKQYSTENMRLYNLLDSVIAGLAWVVLRRRLAERGQLALLRNEMASIMVLDRMTRNGLPVNVERLNTWLKEQHTEIDSLKAQWHSLTGLKVQSGKQVLAWIFDKHGCPVLATTDKGQAKLDKDIMKKLAVADVPEPVKRALGVLLKWKKLSKVVSTYGEGYKARLDERGYLHPSYLPDIKDSGDLGTAAGRLSSSPNVQNVPKDLRWIFQAPRGWSIGDSDLRAVEGRVQATLAEDHELLEMYDREGFDMHQHNLENAHAALLEMWKQDIDGTNYVWKKRARTMLEQYEIANANKLVHPVDRPNMKTFLYGWTYGSGDPNIAKALSLPLHEAKCIRAAYEATRPATVKWRKAVVRSAASRKLLQNAFGRIRYFYGVVPDMNVRNQAINFFPQSTVADMMWAWFPEVEELLAQFGAHLLTQVHDSFVWMAPTENVPHIVPALDRVMTREWPMIADGFCVPATHDVGPSWGEAIPWQP